MSGMASRSRASSSRYSSRVWRRRMACRTRVDPLWTGRCRWRQTFGRSRIASIIRGVTWRGCGLANRMRSIPVHVVDARQQLREVAARVVGRLVVVHDLPEELDLPRAGVGRLPDSATMSRASRIRSLPRVYGTTQKAQNSLQPSMIVT